MLGCRLGTACTPPPLGRFCSRDPIGYEGGNGLYQYCAADPSNKTDPTGLATDSVSRSIVQMAAQGNVDGLRLLLSSGGLDATQAAAAARAAIHRLESTAAQIIANECKGSIWREFPRQFCNTKLADLIKLGQRGSAAAQKALKTY